MSYKWGDRSLKRMEGVENILIRCATMALEKSSIDMTIPWRGGMRLDFEQNEIYLDGNSQKDGYIKKSVHQLGRGLDVIPVQGGYSNTKGFRHFARWMFWAWQELIKQEEVPKGLHLEWGGHWTNFVDMPHWQIVKR